MNRPISNEPKSLVGPDHRRLRIGVVIATLGRPAEVVQLVSQLALQTLAPDCVVVSASRVQDFGTLVAQGHVELMLGAAGSCVQRNVAMEKLLDRTDIICFLDDDYLPSRYALQAISEFFSSDENVVGVTGTLLADGVHAPVSLSTSEALLRAHDAKGRTPVRVVRKRTSLYGCNMAVRTSAIGDVRFDEDLPLYGWQEDVDFSVRLSPGPGLFEIDGFVGVHRGVRAGRSPGLRLGYSQIANPLYLCRKGTMAPGYAFKLASKNMLMNHLRLARPDPFVDRRGRALGNWKAIADVLRGRSHPRRILSL